jgi:hypothetical protein
VPFHKALGEAYEPHISDAADRLVMLFKRGIILEKMEIHFTFQIT